MSQASGIAFDEGILATECCCPDSVGCWKLSALCECDEPGIEAPWVPCDQVAETTVFEFGGSCFTVSPDSPETNVPPGNVANIKNTFPDCETCCNCFDCNSPNLPPCPDQFVLFINFAIPGGEPCSTFAGCRCDPCGGFGIVVTRTGPTTWQSMGGQPVPFSSGTLVDDPFGNCHCPLEIFVIITCQSTPGGTPGIKWVASVSMIPTPFNCPGNRFGCDEGVQTCLSAYDFIVAGAPDSCVCPNTIIYNEVIEQGFCIINPSVTPFP